MAYFKKMLSDVPTKGGANCVDLLQNIYYSIYDRIFDMCTPICVNGRSRRAVSSEIKKEHLKQVVGRRDDP